MFVCLRLLFDPGRLSESKCDARCVTLTITRMHFIVAAVVVVVGLLVVGRWTEDGGHINDSMSPHAPHVQLSVQHS